LLELAKKINTKILLVSFEYFLRIANAMDGIGRTEALWDEADNFTDALHFPMVINIQ